MSHVPQKRFSPFREHIHEIIFEADTPSGKAFDVALLIFIVGSIIVVMLESIAPLEAKYKIIFDVLEWVFTIFFTIEYVLRLYCVYKPMKYATSFFGVIDLLAILPAYISLIFPASQYLLVIRSLRLLRIFRIFKLGKFMKEGAMIVEALRQSTAKMTVFIVFVLLMVIVVGSLMYVIEGATPNSKFTSIPESIYWAIVTITTVGYGDISPTTPLGQFLAAVLMILGYAVIAVPTGIVSSELLAQKDEHAFESTQACRYCSKEGHDEDAEYCKYCGEILNEEDDEYIEEDMED